MQPRVLLDMGELLKSTITVGAFVGLFAGVDAYVLHELVVAGKALHALLALVGLGLRPWCCAAAHASGSADRAMHSQAYAGNLLLDLLHGAFVHEKLQEKMPMGRINHLLGGSAPTRSTNLETSVMYVSYDRALAMQLTHLDLSACMCVQI